VIRKKSAAAPGVTLPVVVERIERKILIRGQKVMLDDALAELYRVSTKALKQAVRRNRDRFPSDFLLELTADEATALRSQTVTLENGRGKYAKYAPYPQPTAWMSILEFWKPHMPLVHPM
jgi:hypothetical protein